MGECINQILQETLKLIQLQQTMRASNIALCSTLGHFDMLNHLGVDHKRARQDSFLI